MQRAVLIAAQLLEAAGVLCMMAGALVSVPLAFRRGRAEGPYRVFREHFGKAILLGLELLVAADIIRTVSEIPTLEQVGVLGIIVLIRTFLSFTLEVELTGFWPWQSDRRGEASANPRARDGIGRD